jgi:uncharacterized protein (TIGR02453 family)
MATIPHELFTFLRDLADHNEREWFDANKPRYERDVKGPALALIADLAGPLHDLSPHLLAIPKAQGGSLFRIYRDTRFSHDKTPYKTHTGMQFRHELASGDVHAPGLYVHLEPGSSGIGLGMWMPPNSVLYQVRQHIVNRADAWSAIKADLQQMGWAFMGEDGSLKRAPKGFDPDHEHVEDLKRKSLAVWRPLSDAEVCDAGFQDQLLRRFGEGEPFMTFLCEAVGLPF